MDARSVAVDWRDAAYWGYNGAKDHHNEGNIYATDNTHVDSAQLQGRTEMSVFHMAEFKYPRQLHGDLTVASWSIRGTVRHRDTCVRIRNRVPFPLPPVCGGVIVATN